MTEKYLKKNCEFFSISRLGEFIAMLHSLLLHVQSSNQVVIPTTKTKTLTICLETVLLFKFLKMVPKYLVRK